MHTAFIAIGSNLGDRLHYIETAKKLMPKAGIFILKESSIIETDPVGYLDQDRFLNGALKVQTDLSALQLLDALLNIENYLGRKRSIKNGPRTIDLDILTFEQETIFEENLTVPHPRMIERLFVMHPFNEISDEEEKEFVYAHFSLHA